VDVGQSFAIAKILMGKVTLHQTLLSLPSKNTFKVTGLYLSETSTTSLKEASAGENLRITFDSTDILAKGSVLCADPHSVIVGTAFMAEVQILKLPPTAPLLSAGYRCVAHIGNSVVEAEVRKLVVVWDKNKTQKKNPSFVKSNSRVGMAMDLVKPVVFQVYQNQPDLGRITLRLGSDTIGFGKIVKNLNK